MTMKHETRLKEIALLAAEKLEKMVVDKNHAMFIRDLISLADAVAKAEAAVIMAENDYKITMDNSRVEIPTGPEPKKNITTIVTDFHPTAMRVDMVAGSVQITLDNASIHPFDASYRDRKNDSVLRAIFTLTQNEAHMLTSMIISKLEQYPIDLRSIPVR